MKKAAAAYTISNAMHRGVVWLTLPLLAGVLNQAELGVYALAQTVATVLAPFLVLNGGAAILREGTTDYPTATFLLRKYSLVGFSVAGFLVAAFWFVPIRGCEWLVQACVLALANGLYSNVLADYQARNQYYRYLVTATFKGVLISAAIYVCWRQKLDATALLSIQAIGLFVHVFALFLIRNTRSTAAPVVTFGTALAFTLPLLPHSLAQWIMSSSDRVILKLQINDAAVGEYTLAFSITALLVLFNAGIGTALPRFAIRNYTRWNNRQMRLKVLGGYSLLAFVSAIFTIGVIRLTASHSGLLQKWAFDPWIKYNAIEVEFMVTWLLAGQYLLGLYQIYATYLFYHRRTGLLSVQTACGAVVNVVLTLILVSYIGTRGAAIATVGGYFAYLVLVLFGLGAVEKSLRLHAIQESAVFVSACGIVLAATMYF